MNEPPSYPKDKTFIVTPWHKPEVRDAFLKAWEIHPDDPRLILVDDSQLRTGCAAAKNRGIREAIGRNAEMVVVVDSDCYPHGNTRLDAFLTQHWEQLNDAKILDRYSPVLSPASRGTPYTGFRLEMPVAASMGFWSGVPDFDGLTAVDSLRSGNQGYRVREHVVYGQYFPLCGMNLAFRPEWYPWCQFIEDAPRFDDIFMGYVFQHEAYRRGYCFSLEGPWVRHSRQSDPWQNLREESEFLETNETLWKEIALAKSDTYAHIADLVSQALHRQREKNGK